uniref:Capsid protein n=1 Tax=viral metagenome TaxID=1070528 RepID=A0A6H1ZPB0_9ZZZZ
MELSAKSVTSAIARAIFRTMIPSYVRQGFSANAMILDARKYMPMYQRATMLQDIRQFQGLLTGERVQGVMDRTRVISAAKMPSVDYGDRPKYRLWGTARFENPETSEEKAAYVTFYTNRNYSPQGYEAFMTDQIDVDEYIPGWVLLGVDFRVVERNSARI